MSARFSDATWLGDWLGTFGEFAHVISKGASCHTSAEIGFSRLVLIGFWASSLEVVALPPPAMSVPSVGAGMKGLALMVQNCLWWHAVWYGVAKKARGASAGELCVPPFAVAGLALAALYFAALSVWYSIQAMATDSAVLPGHVGGLAALLAFLAFWAAFYLCLAVSLLRLRREWREEPLIGDAEALEAPPQAQDYSACAGEPSHVRGPQPLGPHAGHQATPTVGAICLAVS